MKLPDEADAAARHAREVLELTRVSLEQKYLVIDFVQWALADAMRQRGEAVADPPGARPDLSDPETLTAVAKGSEYFAKECLALSALFSAVAGGAS